MAAYQARTQFSGSQEGIFLAVGLEYAVPDGKRVGGSPCVLLRVAGREALRRRAHRSSTSPYKQQEAVIERFTCVIEAVVGVVCGGPIC